MRRRPAPSTRNAVSVARWLALVGALAAAGCGGAATGGAKAADTPMMEQESSLSELDQAEREINALYGPRPSAAEAAPPAASAAPQAQPPVQPSPVPQEAQGVNAKGDAGGDACGVACRALASMTRAADHYCGLSGEGDSRCSSARERVKSATERVAAHCTCNR